MSHAKKIWYVEALDSHTNEVTADELPAENAQKDVLCVDSKKRNFWQCEYSYIAKLLRNRASAQLAFKVFYREGRYGPVREWPFTKKKKLTLASAIKKGIVYKIRGSRLYPVM